MPVYLVHGFRWPREGFTGIRPHAVFHNLDDMSVEYIQNAHSRAAILKSFRNLYPDIMKELDHSTDEDETPPATSNSNKTRNHAAGPAQTKPASRGGQRRLEFIEQYNPDDLDSPHAVSQPYAFVGDKVIMIAASPGLGLGGPGLAQRSLYTPLTPPTSATPRSPNNAPSPAQPRAFVHQSAMEPAQPFNSPADVTALSLNVEEILAHGPGLTNTAWEALADLRDKIAQGEKIGWWVVYNGDPERGFDEETEVDSGDDDGVQDDRSESAATRRVPTSNELKASRGHKYTASDEAPIPAHTANHTPTHAHAQSHSIPRSPGLTALPVRPAPNPPATQNNNAKTPSSRRKSKERDKDKGLSGSKHDGGGTNKAALLATNDQAEIRDEARRQGLRKKFFGRRS